MGGNDILGTFKNVWFWSAFLSWVIAQIAKMVSGLIATGKLDFHYLVSTGGMPSAHSSVVCGLAASFALTEGFDSPVFILSLAFALTTMFDASTVRRAAGTQARLLNEIVEQLFKRQGFAEEKLVEFLGHTRFEVFVGMIMGIIVGTGVTSIWGALRAF